MPIIPSRRKTVPAKTWLTIRLDLASGVRIGPGKVRLLEEVARTGSISAAGGRHGVKPASSFFSSLATMANGSNVARLGLRIAC
jgi:hypothetical protein